jgi:hypothetical protein
MVKMAQIAASLSDVRLTDRASHSFSVTQIMDHMVYQTSYEVDLIEELSTTTNSWIKIPSPHQDPADSIDTFHTLAQPQRLSVRDLPCLAVTCLVLSCRNDRFGENLLGRRFAYPEKVRPRGIFSNPGN